MEEQQETQKPRLVQIYEGWQAHGDGWAVYGKTQEEAIENYWKAVQRHKEILAMPPWYKQVEAQSRYKAAQQSAFSQKQNEVWE